MTDPIKTCTNCGHAQATGDFCETCGTRLPAAAATGAAPGYAAAPAPASAPTPPPYVPPPQYGGPQMPYAPHPRGNGFWKRLFDLSFEEFITPSLIKVLFVIAMVVIGLGVLGAIIVGFISSGAYGILVLIAALIVGFIYLLLARVSLEMIVVFFRIRDNTEEIAQKKR